MQRVAQHVFESARHVAARGELPVHGRIGQRRDLRLQPRTTPGKMRLDFREDSVVDFSENPTPMSLLLGESRSTNTPTPPSTSNTFASWNSRAMEAQSRPSARSMRAARSGDANTVTRRPTLSGSESVESIASQLLRKLHSIETRR